jgi:hypothetical protein
MMKRRKGKTSIVKDQVRRLLPKLSYISDVDETVQISQVPFTKICSWGWIQSTSWGLNCLDLRHWL